MVFRLADRASATRRPSSASIMTTGRETVPNALLFLASLADSTEHDQARHGDARRSPTATRWWSPPTWPGSTTCCRVAASSASAAASPSPTPRRSGSSAGPPGDVRRGHLPGPGALGRRAPLRPHRRLLEHLDRKDQLARDGARRRREVPTSNPIRRSSSAPATRSPNASPRYGERGWSMLSSDTLPATRLPEQWENYAAGAAAAGHEADRRRLARGAGDLRRRGREERHSSTANDVPTAPTAPTSTSTS